MASTSRTPKMIDHSFAAITEIAPSPTIIVDSSASNHFCPDRFKFTSLDDVMSCPVLVIFGYLFPFLSLVLSCHIPLSPSFLQISPIRITMIPSPGHIYYHKLAMKTDSLSSGKPIDNPYALCLMLFIPL